MKKEMIEKIFLILLVLGGLGYGYVTYLFEPKWNEIGSIQRELEAKHERYDRLLVYKENMKSLQEEIKDLEKQNAELSAQIPSSIDKPQMMYSIYSLAKSAEVVPLSLSFEQSKLSGTIQSQEMSFSCTGKVEDVLAFTKKLQFEGNPKLGILSISFVNQKGGVKADIKCVAYASNLNPIGATKKPLLTPGKGLNSIEQMFQS